MRTNIRGKYYISPPNNDLDVKELLKHAVASGSGRPIDKDGLPQGSWTPDILADAIMQVDPTGVGVDLRTVQNWFQNNDRGIGPNNIKWLARVFGCGEPQLVGEWQTALSAANSRFNTKRKEKRAIGKRVTEDEPFPQGEPSQLPTIASKKGSLNISALVESLFLGSPLNLSFFVWAGCVCLAFISFIMGVHSIEYKLSTGTLKQVGLFWAPNWTILEMVVLPLFLITVSETLKRWRIEVDIIFKANKFKLQTSFGFSHWAAFFICFVVVFLIQWSTVHMKALKNGDVGDLMMDWNLIAILRPDVVSVSEATVLSMLAFLYTACICNLFLSGLIILCQVVTEYKEFCFQNSLPNNRLSHLGEVIGDRIFRCAVLGLMVATCIKIQASYLLSDSGNIFYWIIEDVKFSLWLSDEPPQPLHQKAIAGFSSFLLMFATFSVFCYALHQLRVSYSRTPLLKSSSLERRLRLNAIVIALNVVNFLTIGSFSGFSLLLIGTTFVSVVCLIHSTYLNPIIWNFSKEVQP